MKKNLSTFAALAAMAAATDTNILSIAAATKEGETITIGTHVFEIDLGGGVTNGRWPVALITSAVAAVGTLTLTENVTADDTVTIGTQVYTFVDALTGAADEVLIGDDASDTLDNLIAAINGTAGAGTTYGTGTVAHALVTAAPGAGDTMVVEAKTRGTGGNSIATTETFTGDTNIFGAATLASGADPSAANSVTAIAAAINGSFYVTKLQAIALTGAILLIDSKRNGGRACTETLSGGSNAWLAATSYGAGSQSDEPEIPVVFTRTCTAEEAAGKLVAFGLPFTPTGAVVQVRDSTGIAKAWDGKLTLGANHILLNSDASTDIAENDVVTVLAAV